MPYGHRIQNWPDLYRGDPPGTTRPPAPQPAAWQQTARPGGQAPQQPQQAPNPLVQQQQQGMQAAVNPVLPPSPSMPPMPPMPGGVPGGVPRVLDTPPAAQPPAPPPVQPDPNWHPPWPMPGDPPYPTPPGPLWGQPTPYGVPTPAQGSPQDAMWSMPTSPPSMGAPPSLPPAPAPPAMPQVSMPSLPVGGGYSAPQQGYGNPGVGAGFQEQAAPMMPPGMDTGPPQAYPTVQSAPPMGNWMPGPQPSMGTFSAPAQVNATAAPPPAPEQPPPYAGPVNPPMDTNQWLQQTAARGLDQMRPDNPQVAAEQERAARPTPEPATVTPGVSAPNMPPSPTAVSMPAPAPWMGRSAAAAQGAVQPRALEPLVTGMLDQYFRGMAGLEGAGQQAIANSGLDWAGLGSRFGQLGDQYNLGRQGNLLGLLAGLRV